MSAFHRYKAAATAADTAPTGNVADLDYRGGENAIDNRLAVIVRRTAGADRIKLAFYFQLSDGGVLKDVWFLDRTTDWLAADTLYRFADLWAGRYKIIVSAIETNGASFDIYVSKEGDLNSIALA